MLVDRRNLIRDVAKLSISCRLMFTCPNDLLAAVPSAPLESLLPAARVKKSIKYCIQLIDDATEGSSEVLEELRRIILEPQNYTMSLQSHYIHPKPAGLYLDSYRSMKGDLPFQRFLIRSGDVNTWGNLKKKEKQLESANEIRAAFNAYTDSILFSSDTYILNVDRTTRSKMVREDRLPSVKEVINSDLGMRYLYRNEVLSAMDDAKAELEYQLSNIGTSEVDLVVLKGLLLSASNSCDDWFSLIDPKDVKEAFDTIDAEKL